MFRFLTVRDHSLMQRVLRWQAPRWIQIWMTWATRGGDGWLWGTLSVVVLRWGGADRLLALASAVVAMLVGMLLFVFLKVLANRPRPANAGDHCWSTLLPPDQFSFPSGHSIVAFSFALAFSYYYPAWSIGLFFCAASVAASRVLLGLHFLSDVLVGSLIGAILGYGSAIFFTSGL